MGLPFSLSPHLLTVPGSQVGPLHLSQGSWSWEELENTGVLFIFFSRRHFPKFPQNLLLFFSSKFLFCYYYYFI